MDPLFLGIDVSTQSLTGTVINLKNNKLISEVDLNYDIIFPEYNTTNGVINFKDPKVVHSNPRMWIDALELLFEKIKNRKNIIRRIQAISGSAQQHGTVYVDSTVKQRLSNLHIEEKISEQIDEAFTRKTSPIWMDSSTTPQCQEIRNSLGGLEATIKITGSNTYERFSGSQIRKFYQEQYQKYLKTSKIHLVSSFMASILLGKNAPIDYADASGMNLMNIKEQKWDNRALDATAPDLEEKLPLLVSSETIIGEISPYFSQKYKIPSNAKLIAWSGDNPNSLIGLGLIDKNSFGISLGTSDTFFGYMDELSFDLKGEGHLFGAPTGDYMSLICFKNGSLAREKMKDLYDLSWSEVSDILKNTPPGNKGKIVLPYIFPEIVPLVLNPKIYRFGLDEHDIEGNIRLI
jgi:xylulokinase